MADTSSHGLVQLLAETLHERAAYIMQNARTIHVRVSPGVRHCALSELSGETAIREAFRLLLRCDTPVQMLAQPIYCFDCGALLRGGATQHNPDCSIRKMIDETMREAEAG